VNNPKYPDIARDYATTFARLKALRADVFLAPHADAYRLESKLRRRGNGPNPFIDPQEFPAFVAQAEEGFSGNCGRNNPPRRKLAGPINFSHLPAPGVFVESLREGGS